MVPLREESLGSVDAICALIKAGFGASILSHWALCSQFAAEALVPVPTTEKGLDIAWRAIFHSGTAADARERILAHALEEWFADNPPPGLATG